MAETTETFTCESCGGTFDKGWSDAEAVAEAEELFPGINVGPDETGIVCDGCYQHIMGRVHAEAPELTGEGWRGSVPSPIPDYPGLIASLLEAGFTLNPCRDACQDKGTEHSHLHSPWGNDGIIWADGRVDEFDLTQPARLIYPSARRPAYARSVLPEDCYQMASGSMVHVRPGCRCGR